MSAHRRLIFASFVFAILWTAGMCWWNSPMPPAAAIIMIVTGVLVGFGWYGGMRLWMKVSGHMT